MIRQSIYFIIFFVVLASTVFAIEPLFVVKNDQGDTVFCVTEDGMFVKVGTDTLFHVKPSGADFKYVTTSRDTTTPGFNFLGPSGRGSEPICKLTPSGAKFYVASTARGDTTQQSHQFFGPWGGRSNSLMATISPTGSDFYITSTARDTTTQGFNFFGPGGGRSGSLITKLTPYGSDFYITSTSRDTTTQGYNFFGPGGGRSESLMAKLTPLGSNFYITSTAREDTVPPSHNFFGPPGREIDVSLATISPENISLKKKLMVEDAGNEIGVIGADSIFFNLGEPGSMASRNRMASRRFIVSGQSVMREEGQAEYFVLSPDTSDFQESQDFSSRMLWYRNLGAFRTGDVAADPDSIGYRSFAMGDSPIAYGENSVAIGNQSRSMGKESTAIGFHPTATGRSSIAIGVFSNSQGISSTSLGYYTNTSGNFSTALGAYTKSAAPFSTALGFYSMASGIGSTSMGSFTLASGHYSTAIGYKASANGKQGAFVYGGASTQDTIKATADNQFSVRAAGGYRFFTNSELTESQAIYFTDSGTIGIGVDEPSYKLQIGTEGDGTVAVANAWSTFSDERFKENIEELDHSLDRILRLQGVSFDWKSTGENSVGLIAQDVEDIFPEIVSTGKDGYKSINYPLLTTFLIEGLKEQQQIIQEQKNWLNEMEQRILLVEEFMKKQVD